jgi:hypothetical protein
MSNEGTTYITIIHVGFVTYGTWIQLVNPMSNEGTRDELTISTPYILLFYSDGLLYYYVTAKRVATNVCNNESQQEYSGLYPDLSDGHIGPAAIIDGSC